MSKEAGGDTVSHFTFVTQIGFSHLLSVSQMSCLLNLHVQKTLPNIYLNGNVTG